MKVQLPWIGKATGSSAGLIYQSYWGGTYSRSFPVSFHYPDTPAQQACQALYWHIRREVGSCYEEIQYDISSYQKRIRNPYNVLIQSVRNLFLSNIADPYAPWQSDFGVDSKRAIIPSIEDYGCYIRPNIINFDARLIAIDSKFVFWPTRCWLTLVNMTRHELWTREANYEQEIMQLVHPNTTGWAQTDIVAFSACVANEHYMSNFFWLDR